MRELSSLRVGELMRASRALRRAGYVVSLLLLGFVCVQATPYTGVAQAQSAAPSGTAAGTPAPAAPKSFLPPKAASTEKAGQPTAAPPPPSGFHGWLVTQQRWLNGLLASTLREIKSGKYVSATLFLMLISFGYGVVHAAGPGHGKAIVSSYLLADRQTVRRGVILAFLSAFVQALSAITIFAIIVLLVRGTIGEVRATEVMLERASWAIVALFGAWLLFRQVRAMVTGRSLHDHGHHHHGAHDHHHHDHQLHHHDGHAHHHGHQHAAKAAAVAAPRELVTAGTPAAQTGHAHGHDHHRHDHHHGHGHAHKHAHGHAHGPGDTCNTCGHSHMPGPEEISGDWSLRRALGIAFTVGIRPCTGAIGMLFFANAIGLIWAGVLSTFAMAVGTAITVSILAALTVYSRDAAARLAGAGDNRWAGFVQNAAGLVGAILVLGLGVVLFLYPLSEAAPF